MTSITWRNHRSNDMANALSLEETYKRYAAFSGIHSTSFDSLYQGSSLSVTGVTASGFTYSPLGVDLPGNFTVQYHKVDHRQGISITGGAVALLVGTDASGHIEIRQGASVVGQIIPRVTPLVADVTVVFRQQSFDDVSGVIWRSVTVYMNGQWQTTYSNYLTLASAPLNVAFYAYDTDVVHYSAIRVPELGDTAEFGTTDPGEFPWDGLQRTLEGRYLKNFVRWDGSLRAWKRKQRSNLLTLTPIEGRHRRFDLTQLITHARMMGAYIWAEATSADELVLYGHRFQEVDNSMLLTAAECEEEAVNTLKRSQEASFSMQAQARHIPILEPEDRITIDGDEWVVDRYSFHLTGSNATQVYSCRKYVWGT